MYTWVEQEETSAAVAGDVEEEAAAGEHWIVEVGMAREVGVLDAAWYDAVVGSLLFGRLADVVAAFVAVVVVAVDRDKGFDTVVAAAAGGTLVVVDFGMVAVQDMSQQLADRGSIVGVAAIVVAMDLAEVPAAAAAAAGEEVPSLFRRTTSVQIFVVRDRDLGVLLLAAAVAKFVGAWRLAGDVDDECLVVDQVLLHQV